MQAVCLVQALAAAYVTKPVVVAVVAAALLAVAATAAT